MHQIGGELDDVGKARALRGERRADIGEHLRALASKSSGALPAPAPTWPAMNRNSEALTRVICEYCPSGLPRLSGLRILMSGMAGSALFGAPSDTASACPPSWLRKRYVGFVWRAACARCAAASHLAGTELARPQHGLCTQRLCRLSRSVRRRRGRLRCGVAARGARPARHAGDRVRHRLHRAGNQYPFRRRIAAPPRARRRRRRRVGAVVLFAV